METIIRVEHNKENPYFLVSREMLKDKILDMQGKGFLVFLLSKPDDWKIRPDQLEKEIQESRATIYRMLNKLIKAKYIHREVIRRRTEKGRFQTGCVYIVFENKECRQEWTDKGRFLYERDKKKGEC